MTMIFVPLKYLNKTLALASTHVRVMHVGFSMVAHLAPQQVHSFVGFSHGSMEFGFS